MLTLPPSVKIWLAVEPVDMRKGFDGLTTIARDEWKRDPHSGHLFAFVGRRRDRIKILFWDHGGFVLYYKRLENGRFQIVGSLFLPPRWHRLTPPAFAGAFPHWPHRWDKSVGCSV